MNESKFEALAVGLLVVAVVMVMWGEYILIAAALVVGSAVVGLAAWGGTALIVWVWRFVGDTRLHWLEKRQALAVRMAIAQQQIEITAKRAEVLYPHDGFMPIAHATVTGGAYDAHLLELNARRIETMTPVANVPHSLTYSPHISKKNDALTVVPEEQKGREIAPAMDFLSLFQNNKLPSDRFLMGTDLDDGSEVLATWGNLYSALIGGTSGSGKSTLIRSLLAQSALQKGRFVVIDPHYGAGEESLGASLQPLRKIMLCDPAGSEKEMFSALWTVEQMGRDRLSGKDKNRVPVVLVVDETTALLQRGNVAEQLIKTLALIAQETRKVNIFAFAIGQNFSSEVLPSVVRNSFASFVTCRARRDVARIQSGSVRFGHVAENLRLGQAVWQTPQGDILRFSVPNCTQQHLEAIGANLTVGSTSAGASAVLPECFHGSKNGSVGSTLEVDRKQPGSSPEELPEVDQSLTAEEYRVLELHRSGASKREIIKQVYRVTGGRRYGIANAHVEYLIGLNGAGD